jgi:hypothetical protein
VTALALDFVRNPCGRAGHDGRLLHPWIRATSPVRGRLGGIDGAQSFPEGTLIALESVGNRPSRQEPSGLPVSGGAPSRPRMDILPFSVA